MGEIHRGVSVSFRQGLAFVRGNLHRPYGFGRNGTVFGVAPPHNVQALTRRRFPKSGTVALRNLVPLYLAGTTSGPRQTECTLTSFFRARRTFSRISEACAVQMNGLGL